MFIDSAHRCFQAATSTMALRIHFPWRFLLTVLAFASAAGAAAWIVAQDSHGLLYEQSVILAASAAILGACAWLISERIAHAAHLNTSPVLRLGLAGAVAICTATVVTAPFAEFTTGSGVLWTYLAIVGLYLAAGILPALSALSLMAALEALLAARRGNTELGAGLRPLLRHAALGILTTAVVAYAALELRGQIRDALLGLVPDRVRASGWNEREKALFTQVLSGARCDVLVVPLETGEAVQTNLKHSLDRPARSLITRRIAAGIAVKTGLCVMDPTLVARALGARARVHEWGPIVRLAESGGAHWIVRASVKLDHVQQSYEGSIQTYSRPWGEKARWRPQDQSEWGPIAFSDELPPEVAFEPIATSVVEHLASADDNPAPQAHGGSDQTALPSTPSELANDPGSAYARAERLQLLAATYPPSDVIGEHLWERSLIAAGQLSAQDEAAHVIRARAALHLYRRPYAVALVRGSTRTEARAVLALAQGNLFEAESLLPDIRNPLAVLITAIDLEAMRARYGRGTGSRERRDALLDKHPAYAPLLYAALSDDEWLQAGVHERIWHELARLGVPLQQETPVAKVRGIIARFTQHVMFSKDIVRLPLAIENSYAPLWLARAPQWHEARAFDRLAAWDLYDALYGANRAAVCAAARAVGSKQVRPEDFLAFSAALGQSFAGYPGLEEGTASALSQLQVAHASSSDRMLELRQQRLLRDLIEWTGGETETQRNLAASLPPDLLRAYLDEPPRDWRPPTVASSAQHEGAADTNRANLESSLVQELRALNFSQYDFTHLANAWVLLERLGRRDDAVLGAARQRFVGSPARTDFLLKQAEYTGDMSAYAALIVEQIRDQPREWPLYYRLAQTQLRARDPRLAQRTLLAYPLWRGGGPDAVALSNQAQQGAMLLLRAGEAELARPLFQLGAGYGTGSAAELWSGLWLARLNHNWPEIRNWGRRLHEVHKDGWGLSDAACVSFLLGDSAEGWRTFYEASKQFDDARPWVAAAAGHRIAATGDDELIGFAKHWRSLSGDPAAEAALRQQFVFAALMLDRATGDKTFSYVIAMGGADPTYAALASGYRAFKHREYANAIEHFTKLTQIAVRPSQTAQLHGAVAIPYLAASLAKAGRGAEAQAAINDFQKRAGRDFYCLLASAYLHGLSGDVTASLDAIWQAQVVWPDLGAVSIPPPFQLLETAEKLYEATGNGLYRQALLDMARRQSAMWPWSWAYAFEAKYTSDPRERDAALGTALFLDPQSEHLAGFSEAQRKRAQRWFAANNPFKKP